MLIITKSLNLSIPHTLPLLTRFKASVMRLARLNRGFYIRAERTPEAVAVSEEYGKGWQGCDKLCLAGSSPTNLKPRKE
jgi:hypothetical protein